MKDGSPLGPKKEEMQATIAKANKQLGIFRAVLTQVHKS